jgi:uncharacterized protein
MTVEAFGCIKNTIRLRSGRYFDFLAPDPSQFTLADIGGALSKICRFGGQIDRFYSVAEHLVECARQAEEDGLNRGEKLAVFCHDFHEAFIGDVVKPLKIMFPDFSRLEDHIDAAIEEKFGVDFQANLHVVKEIDRAMLIAERRAFFTPDKVEWAGEKTVRAIRRNFMGWKPMAAEDVFRKMCDTFELNYDE